MSEEKSGASFDESKVDSLKVDISFKIGTAKMTVSDLRGLKQGEIIQLDSHINDPVVMQINNKPMALGELCQSDGSFQFRLLEFL